MPAIAKSMASRLQEAKTAFSDTHARIIADLEHSQHEERFLLLGMSDRLRVLVVCHCYRDNDGIIRIISARKANRSETRTYEEFLP
jgi:uncharacterized protein